MCRFAAIPVEPRGHRLASAVLAALGGAAAWASPAAMAAPNLEYDTRFLVGTQAQAIDVDRLAGSAVAAGTYRVDIQVNGDWIGRRDVRFAADEQGTIQPCLDPGLMADIGLDADKLARHLQQLPAEEAGRIKPLPQAAFCESLGHYVPGAETQFDSGELRLDISIPQLFLDRQARGWVNPEQWDAGVPALRSSYSLNHQRSRTAAGDRSDTWLGLDVGVNVGNWRLSHSGNYSNNTGQGSNYQSNRTYAARDLTALQAQLVVGESSTRGDLFPGVGYVGVSVVSDERMLPDSQSGYAPVVRGVAQSTARVVIRQRGQIVHETTVAPGPFEITDLYGTSYGGDLDVSITETDGSVQSFVVPFAAVPQLLREGQNRYSATVGRVRDTRLADAPEMLEATWRRGVSNLVTGFGGVTVTKGYAAALIGGAYNTPWGAIAGDITASRTSLPDSMQGFGQHMSGQSARLTFSKSLVESGTNVSLAAYRYSTDGYLSLSEALHLRENLAAGLDPQRIARQRSRLDLNINQTLAPGWGALYMVGSNTRYWNRNEAQTSFDLGYSNQLGRANYSISARRTRVSFSGQSDPNGRQDTSVHFALNVPLGTASRRAPSLTVGLGQRSNGRHDARLGLSGSAGKDRAFSYGASVSQTRGQQAAYNANAGYRHAAGQLTLGYGHGGGARTLSVGASGGLVLHGGGLNLAQTLGDTIGILHVPGAANAAVSSSAGVRTNRRGYAVVPYLTPYRMNEVTVDPKGLPLDLELQSTSARSAPRAGAVVKLGIKTDVARSALIKVQRPDGQPLPFGLDVTDGEGKVVGVVGQAGRAWVRGVEERGQLFVRWGEGSAEACQIEYDLAQMQESGGGLRQLQAQCGQPAQQLAGHAE